MTIKRIFQTVILLAILCCRYGAAAQSLLNREVTLVMKRVPMRSVLDTLSRRCDVHFSYNSSLVNDGAISSVSVTEGTMRQVLDQLFQGRYQYQETGQYVIIQPAQLEKWYAVSGYVSDCNSGERLSEVSVVERQQLVSTLTDANGYYKLYIKESRKYPVAQLTVSKGSIYNDTSIQIAQGYDQSVDAELSPANQSLPEVELTSDPVERTWMGRLLLSSRMRIQSANLARFFVDKPYQFSVLPGIGTHGRLSGQVTNSFSLNMLGGYAAGLNGVEIAGLFNITKGNVRKAQAAGLFNLTGGSVEGVQIAGLVNKVSDSVTGAQLSGIVSLAGKGVNGIQVSGIYGQIDERLHGVQISGIANVVLGCEDSSSGHSPAALVARFGQGNDSTIVTGIQIAGIVNGAIGRVDGAQIAGIVNYAGGAMSGIQVAGIANHVRGSFAGTQIAAIINKADTVRGMQIGLINIADSVSGYSIGLLNIAKKGYRSLSIATDELGGVGPAWRAGNPKLYGILQVGLGYTAHATIFSWGYGLGRTYGSRNGRLNWYTEGLIQGVAKSHQRHEVLYRFDAGVRLRIGDVLTIFGGPGVTWYPYKSGAVTIAYERLPDIRSAYRYEPDNGYAAWIGWKLGVVLPIEKAK